VSSFNYNQFFNPWLQATEPYQAGKTFEYVTQTYGFSRDQILRLAGNETTLGFSPLALKSAQEALPSSNFYDEPHSEFLIKALEDHFASEGIDMSRLGMVVGTGMDSVIEHCLINFTTANDSIINLPPTFIYYDFSARRRGLEIINVNREPVIQDGLCSFKVSMDKILGAIKPNTKMLFLCSPNNPDGSIIELDFIENLAQILLEKNILFFVDHAYIEFCSRSSYDARQIIHKFPNMIIGYTFSKAYALAGFRVGYGLMHKELKDKYLSLNTPFLCSRPSLAAAQSALKDKEHLQKILDNNDRNRPLLIKGLQDLGYKVYQSYSNFVLTEHPSKSSNDLVEHLMSRGIIIRAIKTVNPKTARITVGTDSELARVLLELKI